MAPSTARSRAAPSVLIVGCGVAGLTLARFLSRSGVPCRVFEASSHGARADRGLGLWGRSQAALSELGLDPVLHRSHFIPAAAYRNREGTWLSRCSDNNPANARRVCTLRESALLAALAEGLPEGTIVPAAELVGAQEHEDRVALSFADGATAEGSIVVGADGVRSAVRRLLWPAAAAARDTGLVSWSGILDRGDFTELAFESLGGGRRFACVPLGGGAAFWFATRRAVTADCGAQALGELRDAYAGWHDPVPRVLHAAACAAAEAAMERGPAGLGSPGLGAALRAERILTAPRAFSAGRAALLGDAANALPINLAQGAAAAIEGAFVLGSALARHSAPFFHHERAFAEYRRVHEPRLRQCELVTRFTEGLASPASPALEAARDSMRLVPRPLNGWVFDAALEWSLGDRPGRTRALWPLETSWRGGGGASCGGDGVSGGGGGGGGGG